MGMDRREVVAMETLVPRAVALALESGLQQQLNR